MQWLRDFRADIGRYAVYQKDAPILVLLGMHQGLWALLQYRIAHAIYRSGLPNPLKRPLLILMVVWQKLLEVMVGISIEYRSQIGAGFYIGHFGNIFIGSGVVIGPICNVSQGVTIGVSGRGERRGYPRLGARVHVNANAVLVGPITVADGALIGANAVVTRDVPANAVIIGNPAQVVSYAGSAHYLDPEAAEAPMAANRVDSEGPTLESASLRSRP